MQVKHRASWSITRIGSAKKLDWGMSKMQSNQLESAPSSQIWNNLAQYKRCVLDSKPAMVSFMCQGHKRRGKTKELSEIARGLGK